MNINYLHISSKGYSVRNKLYSSPLKFQVLSWLEVAGVLCLGEGLKWKIPLTFPFLRDPNVRVKNKCHDDCHGRQRV